MIPSTRPKRPGEENSMFSTFLYVVIVTIIATWAGQLAAGPVLVVVALLGVVLGGLVLDRIRINDL